MHKSRNSLDRQQEAERWDVQKEAERLLENIARYCGTISAVDTARNLILSYTERICKEQRNRDRAVYSINRTKTSIEIKDAILKAPLLTDNK